MNGKKSIVSEDVKRSGSEIKRKTIAKERNQFVALALFRKAGVHRKSNKALRKAQKQEPLGV